MLRFAGAALALFLAAPVGAQTAPSDWTTVKDAKGACKITVPHDWTSLSEGSGAVVFHDPTTAIAVVTSQPGQAFKPLTERQIAMLGVPKEKIFENSARRLFYQDKVARTADDTNSFSSMVPGDSGSCSCHVVFAKEIPEETAKKIALSIAPAEQQSSER
jgi:hypothetical protein